MVGISPPIYGMIIFLVIGYKSSHIFDAAHCVLIGSRRILFCPVDDLLVLGHDEKEPRKWKYELATKLSAGDLGKATDF